MSELSCHDCGLLYGSPQWIEAVVPNHIWNKFLSPTGDEGGILCINCMAARAAKASLSNVFVRLTAGPFVTRQMGGAMVNAPTPTSPVSALARARSEHPSEGGR